MKQRGKTIVPRNPYAIAASYRKAGAHEKTAKIRRRDARQALQRALREGREETFPHEGKRFPLKPLYPFGSDVLLNR